MKTLITNYTFDASAKTITFGDYANISLESVLLITNVTDNIIIYNFSSPEKGGSVATNVLTLTYDTSTMSDTDELQIYYDDPNATQEVALTTALPSGTNNIGDVDIISLPNEGQQTMANSISVAVASDQSSVPTQLNANQTNTTGTITTSTSTVVATDLGGIGAATISIYGTYAGVNATFEVYDGVNWVPIFAQPTGTATPTLVSSTGVLTTNSTNTWNISPILGWQQLRVRATAYTSGTANVIIAPSAQFTQYLTNVGSMPAITGTVTANLGTAGTAATSLGKAEDAVHTSGDVGVMSLAVRQDSEASLVSASGDYSPLSVDSTGKLRSNVSGSVAHDAVDAGNPIKIGGKASSSTPTDVAAGDRVDAYFDLKGRLKVDGSDATQPVSASSLPLPTGAATSANQTTGNGSLATIAGAVSGTEMQVDVLTLPSLPAGTNNIGDVDVISSVLPTGASTSAKQDSEITHLLAINSQTGTIASNQTNGSQKTLIVDANSGNTAVILEGTDRALAVGVTNTLGDRISPATETTVNSIKTNTTTIAGAVSGSEMQVDVVTMPTTTVQATNLDIRDLTATDVITANLSATDNAVLDSIDTAVNGTLDVNIVSGGGSGGLTDTQLRASPVVVDLGTNNDVTVTGTVTTNAGTNTSTAALALETGGNLATIAGAVRAEDVAHTSGDTGIMALAVRSDSEASLAGSSGDYIPLMTDGTGKLRTSVAGTIVHDATDAGAPVKIGGKALSSAPTDVSSGDRTDAYFDLKGRLKVDASDVAIPIASIVGTANFAVGQVSVTTSATQIVASRATRRSVTIVNLGTTDIYIGGSGVTTSTGQLLLGVKGTAITMEVTGAVYGIVGSGTQSVSFEEEYA